MTTNSGTSSTSTGSCMIMDKALRPERLEVLPNSKDSAKTFKHWKMTFEHYAAVFPESSNRLHILINLVAPEVYDLFCQDATYEEAITTLTNCYISVSWTSRPTTGDRLQRRHPTETKESSTREPTSRVRFRSIHNNNTNQPDQQTQQPNELPMPTMVRFLGNPSQSQSPADSGWGC